MSVPISKYIANFVINKPAHSIFLIIIFSLISTIGVFKLKSDFSHKVWFKKNDPLLKELDRYEKKFGTTDSFLIVIHHKKGIFNVKRLKQISEITNKAWLIHDVVKVESIVNYNLVFSKADDIIIEHFIPSEEHLNSEFLKKRINDVNNDKQIKKLYLSEDLKSAVIYCLLKPDFDNTRNRHLILKQIKKLIHQYNSIDGLKIVTTGEIPMMEAFKNVSKKDLHLILPFLFIVISLVLMVIYKTIYGALLPVAIVFISILTTIGLAGWLGIKFDLLTSMLPNILLAICIADSVHLLTSYVKFLKKDNRKEAVYKAIIKNFRPTVLTTISSSIGFFSLTTTNLAPVQHLGLMAGIGTIIAWFLTIFFLMPLLIYLPFYRNKNSYIKNNLNIFSNHDFVYWILKKREWIYVGSIILFISAVYLGSKNEINAQAYDYFDEDLEVKKSSRFMEENVGGFKFFSIVIDSEKIEGIKDPTFLKKIDKFQNWLKSLQYVTSVSSILDVVKKMNQALNNGDKKFYNIPNSKKKIAESLFLYEMSVPPEQGLNNLKTYNNKEIRITVKFILNGSKYVMMAMDDILKKAKELNLLASMPGKTSLMIGLNKYIVKTFFNSMLLALLAISVLMGLVFKSFKLGLLSMIPNILPPIIGMGILQLLGQSIDIGTVLIFSVCLGITVDDTIYFLSDYQKLRKISINKIKAIQDVLSHTGHALILTTIILVSGFSLFSLGSFIPNVNFGIITSIVLLIAILADLVLLPSILLKNDLP